MRVEKLTPLEWKELSPTLHKQVFQHTIHPEWERIDYALICVDEDNAVQGYLTAREQDENTVFWQWGGVMPLARGTAGSGRGLQKLLAWASERYTRMKTYVENDNTPMLRLYLMLGAKIVGIKYYEGKVFLEHAINLKETD